MRIFVINLVQVVGGWARTSIPSSLVKSKLRPWREVSYYPWSFSSQTQPTPEFKPELGHELARKVIGRDQKEGKVQQTVQRRLGTVVADTNSRKFHEIRKLCRKRPVKLNWEGHGEQLYTPTYHASAEQVCVLSARSQRFRPSPDGRDTRTLE